MQISEIHRSRDFVVSFELFPPKTPDAESTLFDVEVPRLVALRPAFMTCTYGAGGSTRTKTLDIVARIKREHGMEVASHLTCVGASRDEIGAYLDRAREHDITNIVALRGDPPRGDAAFRPHPDGFHYASQLVPYIKQRGPFDVAVAAYPEGHPECTDKRLDWQRCRDKVEGGADVVITQLFYDNRDFFEFDDHMKNKLGVKVPIVPGVLPILSTAQIQRFTSLCGAKLPPTVLAELERYADDNDAARQFGIDLATQACEELIRYGVPGIHFYVLNRAHSVTQIMRNLGLGSDA